MILTARGMRTWKGDRALVDVAAACGGCLQVSYVSEVYRPEPGADLGHDRRHGSDPGPVVVHALFT